MTLAKLIAEAKHGSGAAQQILFEKLSPRSKMLCLRYIKNNEDAEEIMLDAFYKFFKSLSGFNYSTDNSLYAYIKRIMVNECLMKLRKMNSFIMISDSELAAVQVSDNVFETMEATEIYNLILKLPVGYRTIFNLFAIEGYEHREIAVALGISESTSRSQLTRGRALLQKLITANEEIYGKEESQ